MMISESFTNKKYCVADCFDDHSKCDFYTQKILNAYEGGLLNREEDDPNVNSKGSIYGFMDDLLEIKLPHIEKIVKKSLFPTYSYARIYCKGSFMTPHTDRPACEYSATVTLDYKSDGPYPIYFNNECILLEKNQMAIYKGSEVVHWRDFWDCAEDDWVVQVFLHYVDQDGPFASERNDIKRKKEAEKLFGKKFLT